MFCPNCGCDVGEGVFCPQCGTRVRPDAAPTSRAAKGIAAVDKIADAPWAQKLADLHFMPAIIAYALIPIVWLINSAAFGSIPGTLGSFSFWLEIVACALAVIAMLRNPIDKLLPVAYGIFSLNALVYILRYIASRFTYGIRWDFGSVFGFFVDALIIFAFAITAVVIAAVPPMFPSLAALRDTARKLWFLPALLVGGLNLIGLVFSFFSWLLHSNHSFLMLLLNLLNNLLPIVGIVVVCLQVRRQIPTGVPIQPAVSVPPAAPVEPAAPVQPAAPVEPAAPAPQSDTPTASDAPAQPAETVEVTAVDDAVEKLIRYKKLLDRGIITQDEFDEKKRQFLQM